MIYRQERESFMKKLVFIEGVSGVGKTSVTKKLYENPDLTRDFYHALTGWEKREAYGCPAVVSDSGLVILFMGCDFDYTSSVWLEEPDKQQKQMHFNFQVNDLPAAVEEAIKLGATKATAQYGGDHFITMFDPEGHPFCLCKK